MTTKCPKCKGYDIDVCPDLSADYQCQECGHKIKSRKPKERK